MYGYPNSVGIIRISLDLIRYEFFLSKSNLMFLSLIFDKCQLADAPSSHHSVIDDH